MTARVIYRTLSIGLTIVLTLLLLNAPGVTQALRESTAVPQPQETLCEQLNVSRGTAVYALTIPVGINVRNAPESGAGHDNNIINSAFMSREVVVIQAPQHPDWWQIVSMADGSPIPFAVNYSGPEEAYVYASLAPVNTSNSIATCDTAVLQSNSETDTTENEPLSTLNATSHSDYPTEIPIMPESGFSFTQDFGGGALRATATAITSEAATPEAIAAMNRLSFPLTVEDRAAGVSPGSRIVFVKSPVRLNSFSNYEVTLEAQGETFDTYAADFDFLIPTANGEPAHLLLRGKVRLNRSGSDVTVSLNRFLNVFSVAHDYLLQLAVAPLPVSHDDNLSICEGYNGLPVPVCSYLLSQSELPGGMSIAQLQNLIRNVQPGTSLDLRETNVNLLMIIPA